MKKWYLSHKCETLMPSYPGELCFAFGLVVMYLLEQQRLVSVHRCAGSPEPSLVFNDHKN